MSFARNVNVEFLSVIADSNVSLVQRQTENFIGKLHYRVDSRGSTDGNVDIARTINLVMMIIISDSTNFSMYSH